MSVVNSVDAHFEYLAQPKPTSKSFVEDRRSVYWVDKLPPQPPTDFDLSPRMEQLVKPKKYHKDFKPDYPTPIRTVPTSALNYEEKKRLAELAESKTYHKNFVFDRSVLAKVSDAAQNASPTKRLAELAKPKNYDPLLIKSNSSWEWGAWKSDVPKEALSHIASARLETLAEAKKLPIEYQGNRPVMWPVSDAARNTQPTTRQHQLARPKTRTALDQDYDPYKVSFAAKNAVASPRIGELAAPIPRKVKAKKT